MRTLDDLDATRPWGRVGIIDTRLRHGELFGAGPLTALITPTSVTRAELAAYIERFGLGPNGRYERTETNSSDGIIELDRTVGLCTRGALLDMACKFEQDLEECFPGVSFQLA